MIASISADHVLNLYFLLESHTIQIWIDGGWGVDALLGHQTRPHKDLDIAMNWSDVPKLRGLLASQNFAEVHADNQWNFVLRNPAGHELDVHAFVTDPQGHIIDGIKYPAESLEGHGAINHHPVRCIRPDWMVQFHSGYELKRTDYDDVSALCEKFNIELPSIFNRFKPI